MTRILTVQDISCLGQCSLTVALPIISACGIETVILPSAVLSTHTGGFQGFTFRDLTEDIPKIQDHWLKEKISFDAIYTGYLGSLRQIDLVKDLRDKLLNDNAPSFIDPAMADNGKLYTGFDKVYVEAMKSLLPIADVLLPNITEACFLSDTEYKLSYDREWIYKLCDKLIDMGAKTIVLTGVSFNEGKTGVLVYSKDSNYYYEHEKIDKSVHGTGDIYASSLVGSYMRGKSLEEAAKIAADFVVISIKETLKSPEHWYGAKFEGKLGQLIKILA